MNMIMVIAVYAVICRELGIPLWFPGSHAGFSILLEATDVAHLANAAIWTATEPRCGNEVFNITNGDYFRWQHLWPGFAEYFGMKACSALADPAGRDDGRQGPRLGAYDPEIWAASLSPRPARFLADSASSSSVSRTTPSPTPPRPVATGFTTWSRPRRCSGGSSRS